MAFVPKNQANRNQQAVEVYNHVEPKSGNRKGRVSLIIDLGTQPRQDYIDKVTGEAKPKKPVQQVAVFIDLVNDVVDYGGDIGKAQYRMMINRSFAGDINGIDFVAGPVRDTEGNAIPGKPWQFHPTSPLTKIANAIGHPEIAVSQDIEQLLNMPLMVQVEVKKTPHKEGKKDNNGNPIVYTNINWKSFGEVPEDDDTGQMQKVAELMQPARLITFDNCDVSDVKFIRAKLRDMIRRAPEYPGSKMEEAFTAFEGGAQSQNNSTAATQQQTFQPAAQKPAAKAAKPKQEPKTGFDDMDDDIPF